jgi:hypothetical protein
MIKRPILRFCYEQISLDEWARHWPGCYEFYQSNYPLDLHTPKFLLQSLMTDAILTTAIQCAWFRQVFSASMHAFSVPAEGNISEIAGLYLALLSFNNGRGLICVRTELSGARNQHGPLICWGSPLQAGSPNQLLVYQQFSHMV